MAKKNTPGNRAEEKAATAAKRQARREKAAHQAAALKAQRAARQRKERLTVGAVVAVVLALVIGGVWWQISRNSGPVPTPEAATSDFGFTVGEAEAETHVEIFADYLCPACAAFESSTDADLAAAVESGAARVTYYPVVILDQFGDYSERAANAVAVVLDTAGVEAALEFNRALFAEQPSEEGTKPDDDWLIDLAVESGAEESQIRDAIEGNDFSRWVKEGTQSAEKRGMQGTPTIFINDEKVDPAQAAAAITQLQKPQEG